MSRLQDPQTRGWDVRNDFHWGWGAAGDGSREKRESQGRGEERKTQLALKQHDSPKSSHRENDRSWSADYFIKLVCKRFL